MRVAVTPKVPVEATPIVLRVANSEDPPTTSTAAVAFDPLRRASSEVGVAAATVSVCGFEAAALGWLE